MASLDAICETCGQPNEKRNMHVVSVERVVGRSSGTSHTHRSGNRHSTSFSGRAAPRVGNGYSNSNSSRSNNRVYKKVERVWVCNTCRDPFQPAAFMGKLIKFGVFMVIAWVLGSMAWHAIRGAAGSLPSVRSPATSSDAPHHSQAAKSDDEAPLATKPPIIFAAPKAVVQAVPTNTSNYPPCSTTVTDHCVGN